MKDKTYFIGLDIGSNSVGWAITDSQGKLMRVKGKTGIGARLFKDGHTAADRRKFRTTRRRLNRRKWRLKLLDQIFSPHLAQVDDTFLARLKESNISPKDDNKKYKGSLLFPNGNEGEFYKNYPTIYHLRNHLMKSDKKADLREIYLAIHHIVKYRGNFLNNTPTSRFNVSQLDLEKTFSELNKLYEKILLDDSYKIKVDNYSKLKALLLDENIKKSDKKKSLSSLYSKSKHKELESRNRKITTQISNALLGYKVNWSIILDLDIDDIDSFSFNDADIDGKIPTLFSEVDENRQAIVEYLNDLYSQITLAQIVPDGDTLSESMIKKYNQHDADLDSDLENINKNPGLLRKLINSIKDPNKKQNLKDAYSNYINNNMIKSDKKLNLSVQESFYKQVKKNLDDSKISQQIFNEIDAEKFMPKQRTSQNGVIPYQLHQLELDQIIKHQSKFYPWLAELNPNEKRRSKAKYKLDELIAFKIPYYVGPLITSKDQKKSAQHQFAWMVRKEEGNITPWNFDQKVDRNKSANRFIKRMTTKDTYLIGEDVLPAESLIYEKYEVLNELNNIKAEGRKLTVGQKQKVYQELFMDHKKVTIEELKNNLISGFAFLPEIKGLSDSKYFNSNLGTYLDFKKIFGSEIDRPKHQTDFEKIIEWSTIFEDRSIYKEKLQTLNWLTEEQINKLVQKRYRGWGRLSKKLLTDIKNSNGKSIMDELWSNPKNPNFMQVISEPDFAKQINNHNENQIQVTGMEDILEDAYTSPQNKKAIRQVMKVVDDIQKAMHNVAPAAISIEFSRSPDQYPRRTQSRQKQIENIYKKATKEIVNSDLMNELKKCKRSDSKRRLSDKLYLYFIQLGRDIYTGLPIDIDELYNYDIDHILPQAFIKDDSLSNRVLTAKPINNAKSNNFPIRVFGTKWVDKWKSLANHGLISERKLNNLLTDPDKMKEGAMKGFIHRQLVETRQVIKLTANILGDKYKNNDTKIIEIPAKLNSQMRKDFGLIKNREINDYHHAVDAYLTVFLGRFLYLTYPKLRRYFVYGDFKKLTSGTLKMRSFNFLNKLESTKEDYKKIIDQDTNEVIWDKNKDIDYIKRIYNFKFMLITHEVKTHNDAFYGETIYKAKDTKNKNKIPIKNNKPTNIYGGFIKSNDSYMSIIKIRNNKSETVCKTVGIPLRFINRLKIAETISREKYLEELKIIISEQLSKGRKSKVPLDSFRILLDKVLFDQLIIDGPCKELLGTATYLRNAKELVLSPDSVKSLANYKQLLKDDLTRRNSLTDEQESQQYIKVYEDIVDKVNKFMPLYDINKFRDKLDKGKVQFSKLPNNNKFNGNKKISSGKREIIDEILNGLHDNATFGDLKEIGFSTPFGKMQVSSGVKLSPNAIICYQSPTGLFERRVAIKDL